MNISAKIVAATRTSCREQRSVPLPRFANTLSGPLGLAITSVSPILPSAFNLPSKMGLHLSVLSQGLLPALPPPPPPPAIATQVQGGQCAIAGWFTGVRRHDPSAAISNMRFYPSIQAGVTKTLAPQIWSSGEWSLKIFWNRVWAMKFAF
jgi:hypothetical protein